MTSEVSINQFFLTEPLIFLKSVCLLDPYKEYDSDIAIAIVAEIKKHLTIKNPGIIGLLWEFQDFFQQIDEIVKELEHFKESILPTIGGLFDNLLESENRTSLVENPDDEEEEEVKEIKKDEAVQEDDLSSKESENINMLSKQIK